MYAGALVFVLLIGSWPIDYFGRRPMLWAVQIFMLIAAIIEMFATNWTHWVAAKILNVGFSADVASSTGSRLLAADM